MVFITKYLLIDGVILFTSSLILAYLYVTRKFKYWTKRGVIEVKPTPFIGNFGDCLRAKRSAGQWIQNIYNCGAGSPYVGIYLFDHPCLVIRDPELIKNVLIRDFNYFQDRYARAPSNDKVGTANLFLLKNPTWKLLRSKLTPIYTSGRLRKMFELMKEVGNDLDTLMESYNLDGQGEILEMKDLCAKFTTDMIATTAFGLNANSLNNPDAEFRKCGREIFATTLFRNIELVSMFFLPDIAGIFGFQFLSRSSSDFLRKTMWSVILERERSGIKRDDMIDLLIDLRKAYHEDPNESDFEFDGDNLVAQTAIFFTGGFETSSTTLSFTLYEITVQPEIQTKLRNEIVEGLKQTNGEITYDLIMSLRYMDMVVAETLRKYPPLPFIDRKAHADYKVPNSDLIIEKGLPILISITGVHYDPENYPDPDKYDPERFSEENKKSRKPCTYIPFGEGPHICIGMRVGLLQTKLGLVKLLSKYEFTPCKDTMIPMRLSSKCLMTASDGGIFLNLKKIKTE